MTIRGDQFGPVGAKVFIGGTEVGGSAQMCYRRVEVRVVMMCLIARREACVLPGIAHRHLIIRRETFLEIIVPALF